jgi:hypothetical protein
MSEPLSPRDIAVAAAQGVAIALNARSSKGGAAAAPAPDIAENYIRKPIICGMPTVLFEVFLKADSTGVLGVGNIAAKVN